MTHHLVSQFSNDAPARPDDIGADARVVNVPLDVVGHAQSIGTNVWDEFAKHRLTPTVAALDLYRLASLVYAADTRVSRKHGFDGWTRDFVLHLPVHDLAQWNTVARDVETLLAFLSGDRWTLRLSGDAPPQPPRNERLWERGRAIDAVGVMLFSGGLDSFIGAADSLQAGHRLVLMGHYDHPTTSRPQESAFKAISDKFSGLATQLRLFLQPPTLLTGESETSTRSRSFLFMSLAALVFSGLPNATEVVVPENGFIALNAPLTTTRLGALSTRTAHPHTLALMRQVLTRLGVVPTLSAPYAFKTKGEMIAESPVREFIIEHASDTMSCAHPGVDHWQKGGSPFQHCGYCWPCIIRRASLGSTGEDATSYTYDVLTQLPAEGKRLEAIRAVLAAIERAPTRNPVSSVLRAGPLMDASDDIDAYVGVYRRGLDEVARFLSQRSTHTV